MTQKQNRFENFDWNKAEMSGEDNRFEVVRIMRHEGNLFIQQKTGTVQQIITVGTPESAVALGQALIRMGKRKE